MQNIRTTYSTAQSTQSSQVTTVKTAASGARWRAKNGIADDPVGAVGLFTPRRSRGCAHRRGVFPGRGTATTVADPRRHRYEPSAAVRPAREGRLLRRRGRRSVP